MTDAVVLIHATAAYAADLELVQQRALIEAFAERVKSFDRPVFFSLPETALAASIKQAITGTDLPENLSEIAAVRHLFSDRKVAHIAIFNGVYPLCDTEITAHLYKIHSEYRADITYGENLPAGIAPHFVSRDLIESLEIMEANDADVATAGLRPFVEKNINQFHAEVHYQEPDLRLLRLDFSLANARSVAKTQSFLPHLDTNRPTYAQLQPLIESDPGLLHLFPSYLELEFCSTAANQSYFSPLRYIESNAAQLSRETLDRLLVFIQKGFGDTSICASGLGEPLEHPNAVEYLGVLLDEPKVRYVFVETNGIHLDTLNALAAHAAAKKLRIIVLLNSIEKYQEYSGAPQATLAHVKANMKQFSAGLASRGLNSQEILFLQAFKVEENETEIDALYALAEELGASFLLQKYNRYAGLMPERRVSDMTPLERYSCWHLRRDLFIRANGDVAFCKQSVDPKKPTARGNMSQDSLEEIWKTQRADFVLNYREKYPTHLPCANCDEYFTFNF